MGMLYGSGTYGGPVTDSDAYATPAEYRAGIGRQDASDDQEIILDLLAISRYLEGKLHRSFLRDAADVTRRYDVTRSSCDLVIDGLSAAPTSIKVGTPGTDIDAETALTAAQYELYPLNALLGTEPQPYTMVRRLDGAFSRGQRVHITGRWGWLQVPMPIHRACIQLTALWRLETPRATRRISELSETIEASPDAQRIVKDLLDQYRIGYFV